MDTPFAHVELVDTPILCLFSPSLLSFNLFTTHSYEILSWRRSLRGQAQGLYQLFLLDSSSSFTVTDVFFFWKLLHQQAELLGLCFSFPLGTLPPPTPVVMFLKALFLAISLKLSLSTIVCVLMTPQMRSSPQCLIQAQDSSSLIHIHPPSLSLSLSSPLLPPVLGQVQN